MNANATQQTNAPWYILRVPSKKEFYVSQILAHKGVMCYVPFEQKLRNINQFARKKRQRRVYEPRVPFGLTGMVFISIEGLTAPAWMQLFDLGLIRGVVGANGSPRSLDAYTMNWLYQEFGRGYNHKKDARRKAGQGRQAFMKTGLEFKVGDLVEYDNSSLGDFKMKVLDIKDDEAVLALNLFGQETRQSVPIINLVKSA